MITDIPAKNPPGRPANGRIIVDTIKALEYRAQGLSYQEIALIMRCSKQAVEEKTERFLSKIGNLEEIQEFSKIEQTVQDGIRLKYSMHLLDDATVKQSSAAQAATVYGITFDKRYPAKGSQDAVNINVSINSLIAAVAPPERFQPIPPGQVVIDVSSKEE
jgi:cell fate (sporulation/competence/biofilm development) regulator YmcA (YheA/YmcA/DUF963 family)